MGCRAIGWLDGTVVTKVIFGHCYYNGNQYHCWLITVTMDHIATMTLGTIVDFITFE
jgi:hypothetical protein